MDSQSRITPYSLDAERAVLGACLQDLAIARYVLETIREDAFYRTAHQYILSSIRAVVSRGERPDLVTVSHVLDGRHRLEEIGGPIYLAELVDLHCPSPSNYAAYVRVVSEAYTRRRVIDACSRTVQSMYDDSASMPESVAHLSEDVEAALGGNGSHPDDIVPTKIDSALKTWMQQWDDQPCVLTSLGIRGIDDLLGGGVEDGELVVLGGRPGTGKTAMALEIARHVSESGKGVLLISREMRLRKLINRLLAQTGHLPAIALRSGRLYPSDYTKLTTACGKLHPLPLWLDDRAQSMTQIARMVDRWPFTPRLSLVVLDYLQIVRAPSDIRERRHQVEYVSSSCKQMAIRNGCQVLLLSSLSRPEKATHDRRPVLSDLRESGEIEHDADVVILLHRQFDQSETEAIVAKARDATVGIVNLSFTAEMVSFNEAP